MASTYVTIRFDPTKEEAEFQTQLWTQTKAKLELIVAYSNPLTGHKCMAILSFPEQADFEDYKAALDTGP